MRGKKKKRQELQNWTWTQPRYRELDFKTSSVSQKGKCLQLSLIFWVISDKIPKRNVPFQAAVFLPAQGREMILVSVVWKTQLNFCLIPEPRPASLVHQLALGFMWTCQTVIASLYRRSGWKKTSIIPEKEFKQSPRLHAFWWVLTNPEAQVKGRRYSGFFSL